MIPSNIRPPSRLSNPPRSLLSFNNSTSSNDYQPSDYNSYSSSPAIPSINNQDNYEEPPPSYAQSSAEPPLPSKQPPPIPNNSNYRYPSPSPSPVPPSPYPSHSPFPQPSAFRPLSQQGFAPIHPPARPPPPPPRPHAQPTPNPNHPPNNYPNPPPPAFGIASPNNAPRMIMNNPPLPMPANDIPIVIPYNNNNNNNNNVNNNNINDEKKNRRLLALWLISLFSFLILLFVVIGASIPHWFRIAYDYRPAVSSNSNTNNLNDAKKGSDKDGYTDGSTTSDSEKDKAAALEEAERTILYSIGLWKTTMIGDSGLKCNNSDHCSQLYAARVFMIMAIVASFIALIISLFVTFSSYYRKQKIYRIMTGVFLFATFVFCVVGLATGISFIEYAFNQPATDAQHDTVLTIGAAPPLIIISAVTALGTAIYSFVTLSYNYSYSYNDSHHIREMNR